MQKRCTTCLQTKDIGEFGLKAQKKDGHNPICKACCNAKQRARTAKRTPEQQASQRDYDVQYRIKHKTRIAQKRQIYYLDNKHHFSQKSHTWHQANPEKRRILSQRYYRRHKERAIRANNRYRSRHPEISLNNKAQRRAYRLNAPLNDLTAAQWREIKVAYEFCCVYCGAQPLRLTQDHLTPLTKGGSHTVQNIVPACRSCNSKKYTGRVLIPIQPLLLTIARPKRRKVA